MFRALDGAALEAFGAFRASGLLDELGAAGQVVATQQVVEPRLLAELGAEHPGFAGFLEHDRLEPITFPYEWSVSMLADAGLLTLDLQLRLLEHGFSLKDGTALQRAVREGRPPSSTSRRSSGRRGPTLVRAGQFHRMFTFPLLLPPSRLGPPLLLPRRPRWPRPRGRRRLGVARWHPALLLDVTLPLMLGRVRQRGPPGGEAART